MVTFISHSAAETETLGESWGRSAICGAIFGLCGDLGSGKTQLVKGIARGLGIRTRVHSPTFTLVNIYTGGNQTLFHLDLYRLEGLPQISAAGLDEYLSPAGVTVIEWAEKWFNAPDGFKPRESVSPPVMATGITRPTLLRWVEIEALNETERRLIYEDIGAGTVLTTT
jgi:tRNA threonylcarbamoyladenosine biosynthesis protein TsaE